MRGRPASRTRNLRWLSSCKILFLKVPYIQAVQDLCRVPLEY
jgi:hypothetical protein